MYRYDNYTDSFVRIDGEPNTGSTTVRVGVPLKETAITVKKVELTDECIDKIADAVVRKLADRKTEPQTESVSISNTGQFKPTDGVPFSISPQSYFPEYKTIGYATDSVTGEVLGVTGDVPQTEEEKVRDVVRGFINIVDGMRNPTEEEMESVNKYIESISKPTGVNVFDLMDEPRTDKPMEKGEPDEQMDR